MILSPPNSPRKEQALYKFGEACEGIYTQAAKALELNVKDRITVYLFTTNQDCEAATGHSAGYVDRFTICTRIGGSMGGVIAEATCASIDPEAPSFPLIRNGVRYLFDQRDRNVHGDGATLRANGRWPKLAALLTMTNVTDQEAYDCACASFVAFLLQRYGVDHFKMLWRSVLELRPSLERIYGGSLQQMQDEWNAVLDHESKRT